METILTQVLTVYNAIKGQLGDKKTESIILAVVAVDLVLRVLNG